MKRCPFCSLSESTAVADKILYETQNFYVITTVGCLIENYIMIVSKQHFASTCYINDEQKNEFVELIGIFRNLLQSTYGFSPIIFEHGASEKDSNKSGCCVLHAHLHMVPHKLESSTQMVRALCLEKIGSYVDFFTMAYDKPYLLFVNNANEMFLRLLTDSVVPSQVIRRWIAKDLNIADKWDWRQHSFYDNINKTINSMGKLIKKLESTRGVTN
jgi:diadenosine tetraphosphate (Ap4A) HIT family hydrolase